ncbi:MAG: flagellar hook-length control protein FliK [Acidobacteria bacterium]|nr:flagellar hook-length control protein FliK [Acidobacteriota bacterium]
MKAKPIAPAPLLKRPVKPEEPKKPELFAQLLEQKITPLDLPVEETPPPPPTNTVERITALATEISAKIEPAAVGPITIKFDAKTFDGLEVQISRERGQLAVRLVSQTPEVAQILTSNVENLRHRLEERGYRQAIIQVQRTRRAAPPPKEQKQWQ